MQALPSAMLVPLSQSILDEAEDAAIEEAQARENACKQALAARVKQLTERAAKTSSGTAKLDPLVALNVGGVRYETLRGNLLKFPDSRLEIMFSGRHALDKDDNGDYFIDRDGSLFKHVLNFLRDDEVDDDRDSVKAEFEFFGIPWPDKSRPASVPAPTPVVYSAPKDASVKELLAAKEARLNEVERQLAHQEAVQSKEQSLVTTMNERTKDKMVLNVSGKTIATTRATLCLFKDTMLSAMFSEGSRHTVPKDETGRLFVDRDARKFVGVLNVLRNARDKLGVVVDDTIRSEMTKLNIVLPESATLRVSVAEFRVGPNLILSNGNRKATKTGSGAWNAIALSVAEITNGVHEVHLRCTSAADGTFNFMVGFAPSTIDPAASSNYTKCGWYLYAYKGKLYAGTPSHLGSTISSQASGLTPTTVNGQRDVWARLDVAKRSISFAVGAAKPNANDWKECYRDIQINGPLVLAVEVSGLNDSVEIIV